MMIRSVSVLALCVVFGCAPSEGSRVCERAPNGWRDVANGLPEIAIVNTIDVSKGSTTWNSKPVSTQAIAKYLSVLSAEEPPPFILLTFKRNVDCVKIREIRKIMGDNYECAKGACGQVRL